MPVMKEQIIELLKQGRKLEAVATAHRLGGGTLQQAKRYVDAVERETLNGNSPDDSDRVVRSWSVKYNGGKPVSITLRDQYGERQLVEGTLEWNAILAEITQTRNERDTTTEGKDKPFSIVTAVEEKKGGLLGRSSKSYEYFTKALDTAASKVETDRGVALAFFELFWNATQPMVAGDDAVIQFSF